jgi:hypothetical protein
MLGLGRRDQDGRQVRVEHRGRNVRVSRTGGASVRAEGRVGPVNATVNSTHGLRLSARLARGLRIATQNGNLRLQGRWNAGPFGINLSKSGLSTSVSSGRGRINLVKPRYSSFKAAGVQVRGEKALVLNLVFLAFKLAWWMVKAVAWLVVALVGLVLRCLGLLALLPMFVVDFVRGFARGAPTQE